MVFTPQGQTTVLSALVIASHSLEIKSIPWLTAVWAKAAERPPIEPPFRKLLPSLLH